MLIKPHQGSNLLASVLLSVSVDLLEEVSSHRPGNGTMLTQRGAPAMTLVPSEGNMQWREVAVCGQILRS